MRKGFILLVVLTLGMFAINGNAQKKKDKAKSDSISKDDTLHRDSVQVLEWIQCPVCWGSGDCPVCKKYGRTYNGTQLTTCRECLGDGRCRKCFGKGGDHYYVWKYLK